MAHRRWAALISVSIALFNVTCPLIISPEYWCCYLDAEYAEDNEECAADEHDVTDRTKRRQEGLYDELETRSAAYYSVYTQHADI